eukprot:CAMPEP_0119097634 /NCGR_PEP_ID=MMETSP1178-20130426/180084_1 /TAXON_ID=33656 /ORGANISM="unid sp, Strain CCMP2000" /LENGTH=73 /DNA_ID=CAMNT_0007081583 /DNA_START=20 /DNA_END=237 /DNA_ORIENTATION=-
MAAGARAAAGLAAASSISHLSASQMPLSSPVLLLPTSAPRKWGDALESSTGPNSVATHSPPSPRPRSLTTATP